MKRTLFLSCCAVSILIACTENPIDSSKDIVEDTALSAVELENKRAELCQDLKATCLDKKQACQLDESGTDAQCSPCPQGNAPDEVTGGCITIEGTRYGNHFGTVTLKPGEELNGLCQSFALNNETELWVNAVEFITEGYYHHSNWFFVPEGKHEYQDGTWYDCYDNGFQEITAALLGGVLFAQSTQVNQELQRFPEGVAVRIPPYSRIIGATHLLNYQPEEVKTELIMNVYAIPAEEVTVKLSPFRLTYYPLDIPAKSVSEFTATCDLKKLFQETVSSDVDLKLYYIMPHYHDLGHDFRLSVSGGPDDGKMLFDLGGFGSDPFGKAFDPPIDLSEATGLTFTCGYNNPRDVSVGWGIGDQEMCVMLGFAASPIAFDVSVEKNEVLGPDENGIVQNTGACTGMGFFFSQNKAGGTPTP
jgi:hypothetical protein